MTLQQALKETEGKLRYSLLIDEFIDEMVRVREFGADKYNDWDWMRGRPWTDYSDAAKRHIRAWLEGETVADDSGLHHLAHAAVGMMFLYWFEARQRGIDDRPGPMGQFHEQLELNLSTVHNMEVSDAQLTFDFIDKQ